MRSCVCVHVFVLPIYLSILSYKFPSLIPSSAKSPSSNRSIYLIPPGLALGQQLELQLRGLHRRRLWYFYFPFSHFLNHVIRYGVFFANLILYNSYGVAEVSRIYKIIGSLMHNITSFLGLFCKRDL